LTGQVGGFRRPKVSVIPSEYADFTDSCRGTKTLVGLPLDRYHVVAITKQNLWGRRMCGGSLNFFVAFGSQKFPGRKPKSVPGAARPQITENADISVAGKKGVVFPDSLELLKQFGSCPLQHRRLLFFTAASARGPLSGGMIPLSMEGRRISSFPQLWGRSRKMS
jgi:hypothetical protein